MRFLAKITIPTEIGEEASKSGALPRTMRSAMERLKPEAAYFFEEDGKRECLIVFNLDIPSLLKPLFPDLDVSVHVTQVMNAAEFERGLEDAKGRQPVVDEPDFLADIGPVAKGTPGPKPSRGGLGEPGLARDDERRAQKAPVTTDADTSDPKPLVVESQDAPA